MISPERPSLAPNSDQLQDNMVDDEKKSHNQTQVSTSAREVTGQAGRGTDCGSLPGVFTLDHVVKHVGKSH